jgi:hypothetical protein
MSRATTATDGIEVSPDDPPTLTATAVSKE